MARPGRAARAPAGGVFGQAVDDVMMTGWSAAAAYTANQVIRLTAGNGIGFVVGALETVVGALVAGNLLAAAPGPGAFVSLGVTTAGITTLVDAIFAGLGASRQLAPVGRRAVPWISRYGGGL